MGFGSFFKSIFKPVKAVVKWVGNAVADVVDFVVDDILEPVIDVIGGVVEGMLDDPLTTIASIAAMVIPGMQWAVPIIQGASTAIKGGDLGDVILAIGASYAGAQAGTIVGKAVGTTVGSTTAGMGFQVGTQTATAQIASQAASQATSSAIRAVALGGDAEDVLKAAVTGAAIGGASASASAAADYLTPTVAGTSEGADFGFKVDAESLNKFSGISNTIGIELSDLAEGWNAIPETVQNVITSGAAASVTSLATTGEVDENQVAGAIARAVMTTNVTANTLGKISGVSDKQAAVLSKVAGDVIASAYIDVDPYEAYQASISGATLGDLHAKIDEVTGGGIARAIDAISGAGAEAEAKLRIANEKGPLVDQAALDFNNKRDELNTAIEKYKNDVDYYNNTLRRGDRGVAETFRANNIDAFTADGGKHARLKAELAALKIDYDSAYNGFQTASNEYTLAQKALFTSEEHLEKVIAPVRQDFTKDIVETFTTNPKTGISEFNEDEYREIYGLSPSDSPQEHWLKHGTTLAINKDDYRAQAATLVSSVLPENFLDQITDYTSSLSRLNDLPTYDDMLDYVIENTIGDNLAAIRSGFGGIDTNQLIAEGIQKWADSTPVEDLEDLKVGELPAILPEPSKRITEYSLGEDVTGNDIITGNAAVEYPMLTDYKIRTAEWANRQIAIAEGRDPDEMDVVYLAGKLMTPERIPPIIHFEDNKETTFAENIWIPELRRYASVALQKIGEYIPELVSSAEAGELFPLVRTPGVVDPRSYYKAVLLDPVSFEPIEGWSNGAITPRGLEFPRGTDAETGAELSVSLATIGPVDVPVTLYELKERDPYVAMNIAGQLEVDDEAYNSVPWVMRKFVDYAMYREEKLQEYEDKVGTYDTDWENKAYDAQWVEDQRIATATRYDAFSEFTKAFNDTYFFKKFFIDPRIKPGETGTAIATDIIADIANEIRPESYKELMRTANAEFFRISKEEGTAAAALWALQNAVKAPWEEGRGDVGQFIRNEWVGKETLQELPIITADVMTGRLAYKAVRYGALKGGKYSKEIAEELARKWSIRTAIGTEIFLSAAETGGSTANEIYNTVFPELMKSGRYTEEQADLEATRAAIGGSAGAVVLELTAGNILNPATPFVKKLLGKKVTGEILEEISERGAREIADIGPAEYAAKRTAKIVATMFAEGASEAAEELFAVNYTRDFLLTVVPDSDVFKKGGKFEGDNWDALQSVTGIQAAFTGMGTAGTISAIDQTINVMENTGEPRHIPFLPDGNPVANYTFNTGDPLGNLLVNENPQLNTAVREAQSEDPVLQEQGVQTLKDAFGWDALPPVDMVQDEEGVWTEAPAVHTTALAILNTAAPDQFNTSSEVERAFDLNETPYVHTPEDIYTFTGESSAVDLQPAVDTHIDEGYTDEGEVETGFAELGYTPSPEEVSERVGQTVETETLGALVPYVDPRQTTADEISELYAQLGYTPSPEDIAQFTGQGGPEFEAETGTQIAPYVDPRQTTRSEIEEFFSTEGYTPTEAELTEYIAQGGPEFETETGRAVAERYDPLAVISPEVEEGYREAGFEDFIPSDVERFTGQYPETELGGKLQEYMPVATYNSIANILGKRGQDVTETDVDFVTDLIAQQEVLTEAGTALSPLTSQQLAYDVTGDNIIDINDQIMLEQVMTGAVPQTEIAAQSPFAAQEGIAAQIQQQTAVQNQIQNQIAAQTQAQAEQRRMQAQNQYLAQLMETTPVEVKTPPPADIKYVYDPFGESIFATPQQASLFSDPYTAAVPPTTSPAVNRPFTLPMQTVSGGGIIEDKTDEILRALGENK